jgi:hypothetical protein
MLKKLSVLFLFYLVFLGITGETSAQTLYFCEGVDSDGYPITESSVFNIPRSGGYLYFLTRLPYDLNCRSVRYEIYRVDSYGYENYYDTKYQDTQRDWRWFWLKYTFYDTGKFNVYVYDCTDYLLTSSTVRIQYK